MGVNIACIVSKTKVCGCVLHLPHPSSRGAQQGSHSAALLGPSHPHQPCVTVPSLRGGATGTPLRTQKHLFAWSLKDSYKMCSKDTDEPRAQNQTLTWSSINKQHLTQIPDQFDGQQNGHL